VGALPVSWPVPELLWIMGIYVSLGSAWMALTLASTAKVISAVVVGILLLLWLACEIAGVFRTGVFHPARKLRDEVPKHPLGLDS
jgi:hypothetical protein